MYARYFGLNQSPFSIAPDPRYLFMSERHREALAHLLYGVRAGGGFVVLTGEIGAGKTTVCRCFLEQVPERCEVAYVFNPKLTVEELLATVCSEFRIPPPHQGPGVATVKEYVDALNEYLLRTHAIARNNLLIIDEAQSLSADLLEQLRLLTNLETNERKLLQIVLIGQPELRTMLARPELQQLAQRVVARYHLGALTEAETAQYVRHRLAVAGLNGPIPFDARALRRVYRHSRGVPRRINLLCERALLGAYARDRAVVDPRIVDEAAREVLDPPATAPGRRSRGERAALLGMGLAVGVALAGVVAVALERRPAADVPVNARAAAPASRAEVSPAESSSAQSSSAEPAPAPLPAAGDGGPPRAEASAGTPEAADAFDLAGAFASLAATESRLWRELAQAWGVEAGGRDPCAALEQQQLRCFRSARLTLATIRQLDRPGILTLRDAGNRPAFVMLGGLSDRAAWLNVGGELRKVPLVALADFWRGEFSTLWRVPPGYSGEEWATWPNPGARWLARQLSAARGDAQPPKPPADDASLRGMIHAFQLTQGLPSDGVAGPMTLMQLNRAVGIDEPRLAAQR